MLKEIRNALKGVVSWFVIILLVLAFALWGVPEMRNFGQRPPLRVGDQAFTSSVLLDEFNRQVARRRAETGETFTSADAREAGIPDQVVAMLTTRSVLVQEAEKLGLAAPRSLVKEVLHTDERFRDPTTGSFNEFVLQTILSQYGFSVRQFEALLREEILRGQLIDAVAPGGPAPGPFVNALLLREIEEREIAYLVVTDDIAGAPEAPTPDGLQTYFAETRTAYMAPEYRTLHVAILRYEDFREGLETPEDDLRRLYEINRARIYDKPERRTLYQLPFESETQAQAAAAALRQGKPFEALALERGRTLDSVTFTEIVRGDILDPKVAEAAFADDLSPGDIAGPVEGMFGWTLVQLVEITPAETRAFEDVRSELEAQFLEQDTRRRVLAAIDSIEEIRDTGAGIRTAAESVGVPARIIGPVDRSGRNPAGEAAAPIPERLLAEAFRLPEGEDSEAIELPDREGYAYVHVDEVTPARQREYAEVADEVERRWRREERQRRLANTVRLVREAMDAGESFNAASAPLNRAPIVMTLRRTVPDATLSRPLIEQVFAADKGAVVSGPTAIGDAQVIVEVRDIGFARHLAGPGERIGFAQYVGYQLDQELLEAYILALREDYGVRADEQALSRIFAGQ